MDFFTELGKRFGDAAKTASEKMKSGVQATKLNLDLKHKQEEIDAAFTELGKQIYAAGGEVGEQATALLHKLDELHAELAELNDQIDKANNVRRCPNCGEMQSRAARFCSKCGTAMPEDPPAVEPEEPIDAEEEAKRVCPECGAELEPDAQFCTACGKSLVDVHASDEDAGGEGVVDDSDPERTIVIDETDDDAGEAPDEGEVTPEAE